MRLRAFGVLRAWVGARGPAGGIGADGSHSTRILKVDRQESGYEKFASCPMAATKSIMGDFSLDADLGPLCPSECHSRIYQSPRTPRNGVWGTGTRLCRPISNLRGTRSSCFLFSIYRFLKIQRISFTAFFNSLHILQRISL